MSAEEPVMSLDSVIQRILDKGSAESNDIINAVKKEKEKLLEEVRKRGQQNISHRLDEARKGADRLKTQEIARADLESRKKILAAQKELLDAVKAEVLKRLGSPEVRQGLAKSLLKKSETEWKTGKVYCGPSDEKQVKAIVGSRFGGTIDCIGGVTIESDDGTKKLDLRFETLLEDIWEDSVKKLADILWPKQ